MHPGWSSLSPKQLGICKVQIIDKCSQVEIVRKRISWAPNEGQTHDLPEYWLDALALSLYMPLQAYDFWSFIGHMWNIKMDTNF